MSSSEIHPSRWRAGRSGVTPSLVVIHTSEGAYGPAAAEALKRWMATDTSSQGNFASYHAVADTDSVADCVNPGDTAFGAGGVNQRALHLCVAGKTASIPWGDWLANPGGTLAVLRVARWCIDFHLPVVKLTGLQVRDGAPGICGHGDVSEYHPSSGGHQDPRPNFPWPDFIARVGYIVSLEPATPTPPPPAPPPPPPPAVLVGACATGVVAGDTWWAIARRVYGRSAVTTAEVQALIDANGNRPLHPGDWVVVPGHHGTAA